MNATFNNNDFGRIVSKTVKYDPKKHKENVSRKILERDSLFNINTKLMKKNGRDDYSFDNASEGSSCNNSDLGDHIDGVNIGEITGKKFNMSKLEQGMPMRMNTRKKSNNNKKNDKFQEDYTKYNPSMDFNLYDELPTTHISYYDPGSLGYSNLIDETDENLLSPIKNFTDDQNAANLSNEFCFDFVIKFYENIDKQKSFVLNPFNIFTIFCGLYLCSNGNTENEIKKVFKFSNKQQTYSGILKLNDSIKKNKNIINHNSITISIKNGNFNFDLSEHIQKTSNIRINQLNDDSSLVLSSDMNMIIDFEKRFHDVKKDNFYGPNPCSIIYGVRYNDNYMYYEDQLNQIVEIPTINKDCYYGMILPKNKFDIPTIKYDYFNSYSKLLKKITIDNLQIPLFNLNSGYSIEKFVGKYGMSSFFLKDFSKKGYGIADLTNLGNGDNTVKKLKEIGIKQVIHKNNISFSHKIDKYVSSPNNKSLSKRKKVNFIVKHQFLFYIRMVNTNLIICAGLYI